MNKRDCLNRGIIHSTAAALTSWDQMTNTGSEARGITKAASRGNGSASLAGRDFGPKSNALTLQWKLLQSRKRSLIYHEPIFLFSLDCFCSCWKGGDLTWLEEAGGSHIVFIILAKPGSCTWIVTTSADHLSQYLKEVKYLCRKRAGFPPFPKWDRHGAGLYMRVRKFPVWNQTLFWLMCFTVTPCAPEAGGSVAAGPSQLGSVCG